MLDRTGFFKYLKDAVTGFIFTVDETAALSSKAPKASPVFTGGIGLNGTTCGTGGIAFPPTQSAEAGANVLDDYEEGTWEPTITCSTSGNYTLDVNNKTAAYTKIGRVVHVCGSLATSGENAPNGNIMVSLPFPIADIEQGSPRGGGSVFVFNHGGTLPFISAYFDNASSFFYLCSVSDLGIANLLDDSDVDAAWNIRFNFNYITAT